MPSDDTEQQMVEDSVAGDRVALERLLLSYFARLARHVEGQLPRRQQSLISADDILQLTFMQVFRDIGNFEPRSDDSFFAWLKTIASHRVQDAIRNVKRKKRGGENVRLSGWTDAETGSIVALIETLSADGRTPSQSAARHEAVRAIQVAIAGLPADYREAIRLRYLEGKPLEDVCAEMQRSPGAVRGLIDRAKQKLRAAMDRSSLWFSKR